MIALWLAAAVPSEAAAMYAQQWARKAVPIASCTSTEECDVKWAKARAWIAENTIFKVVVDEPALFSTPGPIYASTDLSFVMVRSRSQDGHDEIRVRAWCGNVISCMPKPRTALERLRALISSTN